MTEPLKPSKISTDKAKELTRRFGIKNEELVVAIALELDAAFNDGIDSVESTNFLSAAKSRITEASS